MRAISGKGLLCLQEAAQEICGKSLNRIVTEVVFETLGMSRPSYVWQSEVERNHAVPHEQGETAGQRMEARCRGGSVWRLLPASALFFH